MRAAAARALKIGKHGAAIRLDVGQVPAVPGEGPEEVFGRNENVERAPVLGLADLAAYHVVRLEGVEH